MPAKLTASENVLAADLRWENPTDDTPTAAAACAAHAALSRGWKPTPGDVDLLNVEDAALWVDIVLGLAANPSPSMIALGHSAVAWLNDTRHVARGFTAVLDESGFHIAPAAAASTDMFTLHKRLLALASRHGVELNRLHAYMADYDGPYHDLLADLRTKISPLKIEVRARRSPVTLTVPTDAVLDSEDAAPIFAAAEEWIAAAEKAGFEIQGWGYHFPGCESEDFSTTCAGVAIGYRWYALEVIDGIVSAREIETVAAHENLDLRRPQHFDAARRMWSKLITRLEGLTARCRS